MKYYKYLDEEGPVEDGVRYIETDDGWTIREVTTNGKIYRGSNVYYPGDGVSMGEGQIDYDSLENEDVIPISKEDFDEVWNKHLATRSEKWNKAKTAYPLGLTINGFMQIYFPQGVIVNMGHGVLGVADYQACKASNQTQFMHTRQKITATVKSYDEQNHWVILDSPQVHAEEVSFEFAFAPEDAQSL